MYAKQQYPMTDFDTALRNEYERLVGLCGYLTGGAEDAPDLAQETLIEAWRHQHKLVNPSGLRPWVSAIARNVCLRWKAKAGRNQSLLYKIAQQSEEEASGEASFELLLERHELSGLLQETLARMFVRAPQLLVIDDLSSALDVDTERTLWERFLARSNVTCLIVSHRPAILNQVDQVLWLDEGRVVAAGKWREVLDLKFGN
jgi:DNA-directed RNA polymerase specialized sigma24 family protein